MRIPEHDGRSHRGAAPEAVTICLGICTRQRPEALGRLLRSLLKMRIPSAMDLTLCVVENDSEPRCRKIVEEITAGLPFPVEYQLERRIGIPQARNRLLDTALALEATALVFVDDDEEVDPDWLCALHRFARETDWQVVVQGRVMTRLPASTSPALAPFFQRRERATGDELSLCATNNTLLPLAPVRRHGLRFDESRPTAGGEDTIFFSTARKLGTRLVYCREALVTETIPPERATLWWLCRRKFRVGLLMGSGAVAGKERRAVKVVAYGVKAVIKLLQSLLYLLLLQRTRAIDALLYSCRALGYSLGYFQLRTEPYRQVEG